MTTERCPKRISSVTVETERHKTWLALQAKQSGESPLYLFGRGIWGCKSLYIPASSSLESFLGAYNFILGSMTYKCLWKARPTHPNMAPTCPPFYIQTPLQAQLLVPSLAFPIMTTSDSQPTWFLSLVTTRVLFPLNFIEFNYGLAWSSFISPSKMRALRPIRSFGCDLSIVPRCHQPHFLAHSRNRIS